MTELPSEATTGERIRILRERRGMTRAVLAGLVGRSPDWLKKLESGERDLRSLTMLVRVAQVLGVADVATLTGGDMRIPADAVGKISHPAVPAIREAMHDAAFQPPDDHAPSPAALATRVATAWRLWHTSTHQRTEVGALLPDLIRAAHACVRAHTGPEQRAAWSAMADAYRLVQRMLAHICEPELYWTALDRARGAAEQADEPVALALGAWSVAMGQRAAGYADESVRTAEAGLRLLADRLDDGPPDLAATYGQLQLQAATSYGLDGRSGPAERHLADAGRIADRLPAGYAHRQSAFARSNVDIHAVTVGVGLVHPGQALRFAESIDPDGITSLERRSRLLLDVAAAHHQRRETAAAVHYLHAAHTVSPEAVRYVPSARALAMALARTATGPLRRDAAELAAVVTGGAAA